MTRSILLILVTLCPGRANGQLPVHFEENRGQLAPGVELLARGLDHSLSLSGAVAALALPGGDLLRLTFLGADADARACGDSPMPGTASYLRGADPDRWIRGVPIFARARVEGLYPGVDLVYYGNQGRLEFDLEVAPGVDPAGIELQLEGACSIALTDEGAANIELEGSVVSLLPPRVFQLGAEGRREIPSGYMLAGADRLRFQLGAFDPSRRLVIDPVLAVSSYLGGLGSDLVFDLATDSAGHLHVCGYSAGTGFPLQAPLQGWAGGHDAFVTKLDPTGTTLLYSTYLGGSGTDWATGITVDGSGHAYVVGTTESVGFPVVGGVQAAPAGFRDGFVAKLTPTGDALVYSTYLGGSGDDNLRAIAVDDLGQAHVTGTGSSVDFPLVNPAQPVFGGIADAYVAKLDPSGSALVYSTYLGGSQVENGGSSSGSIALDVAGNALVVGDTASTDFPLVSALQPIFGGVQDAFVAKLDAAGTVLFATYHGGLYADLGFDIAVDSVGNPCVAGRTASPDLPLASPLQGSLNGTCDAFVCQIAADGSSLLFSTYLGGSSDLESAFGIDIDDRDNLYVCGQTSSIDFPVLRAFQPTFGAGGPVPSDGFVTKLAPGGGAVLWSSYLGGADHDLSHRVSVDAGGRVWVGGHTKGGFPLVAPFQPTYGGGTTDGTLARIDPVLLLRDIIAPLLMVRGEAGVVVGIDLESHGMNSVQVDPLLLRFRDGMGADVAGGYTVTPSPGNPTVIAPGTTETLYFTLDVAPTAQLGATTLDASVTGTDLVTSDEYIDNEADTIGTWTVVDCSAPVCGDCNGDGQLSILDSLTAAQAAAAVITLTREARANCNVTGVVEPMPGAVVDVLDALTLAQVAAGLPVPLVCC